MKITKTPKSVKSKPKKKDDQWEIISYYIADGKVEVTRRHKQSGKESKSYRM